MSWRGVFQDVPARRGGARRARTSAAPCPSASRSALGRLIPAPPAVGLPLVARPEEAVLPPVIPTIGTRCTPQTGGAELGCSGRGGSGLASGAAGVSLVA